MLLDIKLFLCNWYKVLINLLIIIQENTINDYVNLCSFLPSKSSNSEIIKFIIITSCFVIVNKRWWVGKILTKTEHFSHSFCADLSSQGVPFVMGIFNILLFSWCKELVIKKEKSVRRNDQEHFFYTFWSFFITCITYLATF